MAMIDESAATQTFSDRFPRLPDDQALHPVRVIRGPGVVGRRSGVDADQGEPPVA